MIVQLDAWNIRERVIGGRRKNCDGTLKSLTGIIGFTPGHVVGWISAEKQLREACDQ